METYPIQIGFPIGKSQFRRNNASEKGNIVSITQKKVLIYPKPDVVYDSQLNHRAGSDRQKDNFKGQKGNKILFSQLKTHISGLKVHTIPILTL